MVLVPEFQYLSQLYRINKVTYFPKKKAKQKDGKLLLEYLEEPEKHFAVYNAFEKANLALKTVLAMNLSNTDEIINFVSQYGPLDHYDLRYESFSLDENHYLEDGTKYEPSVHSRNQETLDTLRAEFFAIKLLLNLYIALKEQSAIGILTALLGLISQPLSERPSGSVTSTTNSAFVELIRSFPNGASYLWSYQMTNDPETHQKIRRDISEISIDWGTCQVSAPFDLDEYLSRLSRDTEFYLYRAAEYALMDMINAGLHDVKLQLLKNKKNKNQIEGSWQSYTMLGVIYYELFAVVSENKIVRKCALPSCGQYFEIIGHDTRKIYCSQRCAGIAASNKYRARKMKKEGS